MSIDDRTDTKKENKIFTTFKKGKAVLEALRIIANEGLLYAFIRFVLSATIHSQFIEWLVVTLILY